MLKLTAPVLALTIAFASVAYAGGPIVIEDEPMPEVVAERPASSVGVLPILLGVVVLCAVLCGGDDEDTPADPVLVE